MKTGVTYNLKWERLMAERQQAIIRLLMSVISSLLLVKWAFDQFMPSYYEKPGDFTHALLVDVIPISLIAITYSLVVWLLLKFKPETMRAVMAVSSFCDLALITFYMRNPAAELIPFYLWYIFYVASVAIRYGWRHSMFALAGSFLTLNWTLTQLSSKTPAQILPVMGFMSFLLLMAFMFGRISDKQFNYQASLAVVNEFRADLTAFATSTEIIQHLLDRVRDILKTEQAWFLPANRGSDGSEAPGLRSIGADPVILSTFREGGQDWNVEKVLDRRIVIVSNNPRSDSSLPEGTAQKLEIHNIAAAPLMVRSIAVGVIYTANRLDRQPIPKGDLQLLELMAIQTAPVVENAILWERLREAVALEERARIARDLHDNFLQTLAAIKFHLERCKLLVQKDPSRTIEGIDRIHDIATKGLGEVRAYLSELRMMGPEPSRFKQAVEKCSSDFAGKAGFEVRVDVHLPDEIMPPNVALAAFQVLRELLTNVEKHSNASHVEVNVRSEDGRLVMEVEDDGDGFDVETVRAAKTAAGHVGLVGVEERLKQSHGNLTLTSHPGRGTRAVATLDLKD